ncbi:hypothetical protein ACFPOA_08545 [Lysobacter niabensis]|uniref:hypothetical protein n=1 Tax=Agrilutibacter niabensis TaxID=380628 RepID=UPI0036130F16
MRDEILERFRSNIARANNLVAIYRIQGGGPRRGRRPVHSSDILRAAVVFVHAALEESFRAIYLWKTPHASENVLNSVPLIGCSRNEKFSLGRLAPYRNKTIQELIAMSVNDQAQMLSVNNASDIANLIQQFGLRSQDYDPTPIIPMIQRRHHIVHQTDRSENRGVGHQAVRSLSYGTVQAWISAVSDFVEAILRDVPDDLL